MCRAVLLVPIILCGCAAGTPPTTKSAELDLNYPVGAFSLTERSGRTVTEQDLRGKVWVASFIFTRCIGPCPAVTNTIAQLQQEFKDEPDVRFVTFTVDPARDDLKALNEYANSRRADPERWLFLTGDEATIHGLVRERFKLPIERKTGPDVKPGDEIGHSPRLVLVDRRGIIRAMCDGLPDEQFPDRFGDDLNRFKSRLREMAKER
jgi:cytochrome oxidase Cu insertion factor (SCO1/SenC/PrrC family)